MKRKITNELIERYKKYLYKEEKSSATIEKYARDLIKLMKYAANNEINKELMLEYKKYLLNKKQYKISSINSFLVAANRLFEYMGWYDAKVKTYKLQQETFCSDDEQLNVDEYKRLVNTAKDNGNIRLSLILQTICSMGLRVSELSAVTVESVKNGVLEINNKGKIRRVFIPSKLQKYIKDYTEKQNIKTGIVFRTSTGKAISRSNIWREMKSLCDKAKVNKKKVFPHNLRHLFAKKFYESQKDIAKLANILGHSSIETTRIYIRTDIKEYKKYMEKLELAYCPVDV